jgi:hypothetical protein
VLDPIVTWSLSGTSRLEYSAMSNANQPVLPQGAGYGVGTSSVSFPLIVALSELIDDILGYAVVGTSVALPPLLRL